MGLPTTIQCTQALQGGFSAAECMLFLSMLPRRTSRYFEWGSGSSTRLAAERAVVVTSVEGSSVWAGKMRNGSLPSNVDLRYVDIGPTTAFSWPVTLNATRSRAYIRAIDAMPPQDVVLVDGRWRVACALRARHRLAKNGVVLVHDFARPQYQVLRTVFHVVKERGTLVVLRPRNVTDTLASTYEDDPNR